MLARTIAAILREERQLQKLTLDDLAAAAGLASETLARIEQDELPATVTDILALSEALQIDPYACLRGERVALPEPDLYFRHLGIPDFRDEDRSRVSALLRTAYSFTAITETLGLTLTLREAIPPHEVRTPPHRDAQTCANAVRRALGCRTGAFPDLAGVFVRELATPVELVPLASSRVAAITIKDRPRDTTLVVLNAARCDPAQVPLFTRVTLAHELAHVLLDEPSRDPLSLRVDTAPLDDREPRDIDPIEKRANAFASALLLPLEGLHELLGVPRMLQSPHEAEDLVERARHAFLTTVTITVFSLAHAGYIAQDDALKDALIRSAAQRPAPTIPAEFQQLPDTRRLLHDRLREAHLRGVISEGRARELLGLSVHDRLPWAP